MYFIGRMKLHDEREEKKQGNEGDANDSSIRMLRVVVSKYGCI